MITEEPLLGRVIAESGSVLEVWTLDPEPESSFYLHAQATNCNISDTDRDLVLTCMMDLPLEDVFNGFDMVYVSLIRMQSYGLLKNYYQKD